MKRQTQKQSDEMKGAVGASDANSGGGAAAGVPDADTGMRAGEVVTKGDVDKDRQRIFPGQAKKNQNKDQEAPKGL